MNLIKNLKNKLPALRRPVFNNDWEYDLISNYAWAFKQPNKKHGDLYSYYEAYNNCLWVNSCCDVLCNEMLNNGFLVNNENGVSTIESTNYLTQLFNHPEGTYEESTYETLMKQVIISWKITGDAFINVSHDQLFDNVPNGFRFIPTELISYNLENDCWCVRNKGINFENDELIHIHNPRIQVKGYKWGSSVLDTIATDIALEILGLSHNTALFKNKGLDPRGVLSFDKDLEPEQLADNIKRLRAESKKNKKGTIIIQGGKYTKTNMSNSDLELQELLLYCRDKIITAFHVPPSKVGIIETASLGTGTGESQDKNFQKFLRGEAKTIESGFNKVLGQGGFSEVFRMKFDDLEDKHLRAQIEDMKLRNGTTFINEVRSGYGLDGVEWGNAPLNYSQYLLATDPDNIEDSYSIIPAEFEKELDSLKRAVIYNRWNEEYDKKG